MRRPRPSVKRHLVYAGLRAMATSALAVVGLLAIAARVVRNYPDATLQNGA